jgi:hypothetical protein
MTWSQRIALVLFVLMIPGSDVAAAQNMLNVAYVEVNDNALSNVGCYKQSKTNKPFFDIAVIFAANINGSDPNAPQIFFNPQVDQLLNRTNQVKELQGKGIKVLLTLLGNHQNAGWSCVRQDQPNAAKAFADRIADVVQKYGLDGIDIDDEYSKCSPNSTSMIMIAEALTGNAQFKGKILSKALFTDQNVFQANYKGRKLAEFLNYGWEMTYGNDNAASRLSPYLGYGMSKERLAIGVNPGLGAADRLATYARQNGLGGVMVFNVTKSSAAYLSTIARVQSGQSVNADAACLR